MDELVLNNSTLHSLVNFFRNLGALLDGVVSVLKNLWLDNWSKSVLLADRSVSGKSVGGLSNSGISRASSCWIDLENGSPLGESASKSIVFSASFAESIKTLSGGLTVGSSNNLKSSIDLDTAVNSLSSKDIAELL